MAINVVYGQISDAMKLARQGGAGDAFRWRFGAEQQLSQAAESKRQFDDQMRAREIQTALADARLQQQAMAQSETLAMRQAQGGSLDAYRQESLGLSARKHDENLAERERAAGVSEGYRREDLNRRVAEDQADVVYRQQQYDLEIAKIDDAARRSAGTADAQKALGSYKAELQYLRDQRAANDAIIKSSMFPGTAFVMPARQKAHDAATAELQRLDAESKKVHTTYAPLMAQALQPTATPGIRSLLPAPTLLPSGAGSPPPPPQPPSPLRPQAPEVGIAPQIVEQYVRTVRSLVGPRPDLGLLQRTIRRVLDKALQQGLTPQQYGFLAEGIEKSITSGQ